MRCNALAFLSLLAVVTGSASGETIPYPDVGFQNPVSYAFTATATGDVMAYFVGNGGALYDDSIGMLVNGVSSGIVGLESHQSGSGQALDLGPVTAGDSLTFELFVANTGNTWYSTPSLNADGANHLYATDFADNGQVPTGTYVGFEDLAAPVADFNYTDEQVVLTDATTTELAAPLPGSLPMFLAGLACFALIRRRADRERSDGLHGAMA